MKNHKKKMVAPIVVAVLTGSYYFVYFLFLVTLFPPGAWKYLLGILPLAFAVLIVAVCIQRIREIRKGEEDDLSQY